MSPPEITHRRGGSEPAFFSGSAAGTLVHRLVSRRRLAILLASASALAVLGCGGPSAELTSLTTDPMSQVDLPPLRETNRSTRDAGTDLGKSHRAEITVTYAIVSGSGARALDILRQNAEAAGWHTDFATDVSFTSSKKTDTMWAQLSVTLTDNAGEPAVLVMLNGI